jgi:hypothetical protein
VMRLFSLLPSLVQPGFRVMPLFSFLPRRPHCSPGRAKLPPFRARWIHKFAHFSPSAANLGQYRPLSKTDAITSWYRRCHLAILSRCASAALSTPRPTRSFDGIANTDGKGPPPLPQFFCKCCI